MIQTMRSAQSSSGRRALHAVWLTLPPPNCLSTPKLLQLSLCETVLCVCLCVAGRIGLCHRGGDTFLPLRRFRAFLCLLGAFFRILCGHQQSLRKGNLQPDGAANRTNFLRGQVSKYGWVDVGSSWLPSDMLAAHLYGQLEVAALPCAGRVSCDCHAVPPSDLK